MTGVALWEMLRDLERHETLAADDRQMLQPAFDAMSRHEVVRLPELIISHVQRLHAALPKD